MLDHFLLTSQRNEVFIAIQEAGLDPAAFKWDVVASIFTENRPLPVQDLIHIPSDGHFSFDKRTNGERWSRYSPGMDTPFEKCRSETWYDQLLVIKRWLGYLKRETEAPDLWASIVGESAMMLGTPVYGDATNTMFSAPERERLSQSINEIRTGEFTF